jgi:hypothetical protein
VPTRAGLTRVVSNESATSRYFSTSANLPRLSTSRSYRALPDLPSNRLVLAMKTDASRTALPGPGVLWPEQEAIARILAHLSVILPELENAVPLVVDRLAVCAMEHSQVVGHRRPASESFADGKPQQARVHLLKPHHDTEAPNIIHGLVKVEVAQEVAVGAGRELRRRSASSRRTDH